ncbi:hypothetical protein [Niveibacterium umoris]|uniref:Uncharacterized protein n=1 Tax=Niveibacterium umoris TaxID=1193620 RepID=A0A840BH96_9RHOO|nr:hypothetical protein [Niveibacterium umoris]MBB4012023.1 hypothetical protein [Niveibacterium umoris]
MWIAKLALGSMLTFKALKFSNFRFVMNDASVIVDEIAKGDASFQDQEEVHFLISGSCYVESPLHP